MHYFYSVCELSIAALRWSLCCICQNRYADARNDYVRLYSLRQVPLAVSRAGPPDHVSDMVAPTHIVGAQERESPVYVHSVD